MNLLERYEILENLNQTNVIKFSLRFYALIVEKSFTKFFPLRTFLCWIVSDPVNTFQKKKSFSIEF